MRFLKLWLQIALEWLHVDCCGEEAGAFGVAATSCVRRVRAVDRCKLCCVVRFLDAVANAL